jgi:ZIP family zinc transporter
LGIFAGFFLYIGASDLIPECHHDHPKFWNTVLIVCGMAFMWVVVRLAG